MQTAVVAVLVLGAALAAAKPPPVSEPAPGPAPWAAYASSAGSFKGRSLVGLGAPASAEDESALSSPGSPLGGSYGGPYGGPYGAAFSPMSPFLKLKPFLPTKPTFMPPVVDPSKFIDMKADFLNSLFPGGLPMAAVAGAAPPAYSSVSARALVSPFASAAAPTPAVKPPPPAFLAELFKALSINKTVANASDPAPAPAMYPGYPGAALAAPVVDPGVFISKKAKFLSDLFAGLAVTTPAPPVPVMPGPDPAALNAELAASLQRLLDSLSTAATPDSTETEDGEGVKGKAKRAADTTALVADAKDKVVATIIGELAELKNGMVTAVSDLAQAQKDADAAAAAAAAPKKPLSPFAAMWAKPTAASAKTTATPPATPPAVEPVRQRVVLLSQVFDMLADMEKDISSSMTAPATAESGATESPLPASATTPSFMDVVKAKINQMVAQSNVSTPGNVTFTTSSGSPKSLRLAGVPPAPSPSGPPVDPTFWIPDSAIVGPDAYLSKTKEFLANLMAAKSTPSPIARRSYKPYKSSFYQQQEKDQPAPGDTAPPAPPAPQESKLDAQNTPMAVAYQLQQLRHHHHNRQPYWWN